MEGHPVSYSRTTITELMIPSYANFGGKIHGGTLLSLMDKVAYACSSKHAGAYCVTVAVGGVNFLQPVEVGELVSMLASVNYVGRTSVVVGIKVIAEDVQTGVVKHTNTSYFTLVAKADNGELVQVPPLILETSVYSWGLVNAAGVVATVPVLFLFALAARHMVSGLGAGAVKG